MLRTIGIEAQTREVGRGHDNEKRQERQGYHEVRDPHEHRIEPSAEVTGRKSERRADHSRHQRCRQPDKQRYPGTLEETEQKIAAKFVGPDRVAPAWARKAGQQIDGFGLQAERRLGQGKGKCHQPQHDQHGGGGDRRTVAAKPLPGAEAGTHSRTHDTPAPIRTRGSIHAYVRSAARLPSSTSSVANSRLTRARL